MNKQRMNVQTIAEILTEELGKLENYTEKIQHASSRVERATERLLNSEVKVNTSELAQIEKNIVTTIKDTVHIPRWFAKATLYTLIACFVLTIVSCLTAGYYYNKEKATEEREIYWYEQYQKLKSSKK